MLERKNKNTDLIRKFLANKKFIYLILVQELVPNMMFLFNLTITDMVNAVLLFIVIQFFNFNEYDSSDPHVFAEQES